MRGSEGKKQVEKRRGDRNSLSGGEGGWALGKLYGM